MFGAVPLLLELVDSRCDEVTQSFVCLLRDLACILLHKFVVDVLRSDVPRNCAEREVPRCLGAVPSVSRIPALLQEERAAKNTLDSFKGLRLNKKEGCDVDRRRTA